MRRYDLEHTEGECSWMVQAKEGDWVSYDDARDLVNTLKEIANSPCTCMVGCPCCSAKQMLEALSIDTGKSGGEK